MKLRGEWWVVKVSGGGHVVREGGASAVAQEQEPGHRTANTPRKKGKEGRREGKRRNFYLLGSMDDSPSLISVSDSVVCFPAATVGATSTNINE